ncbi:hypothetical protein PspLS_06137 [Pyricularia sp. CBS 133598]|nr:hypothetical protein PspLS_06137 [Pyricularia sp. CBS 133598]
MAGLLCKRILSRGNDYFSSYCPHPRLQGGQEETPDISVVHAKLGRSDLVLGSSCIGNIRNKNLFVRGVVTRGSCEKGMEGGVSTVVDESSGDRQPSLALSNERVTTTYLPQTKNAMRLREHLIYDQSL